MHTKKVLSEYILVLNYEILYLYNQIQLQKYGFSVSFSIKYVMLGASGTMAT